MRAPTFGGMKYFVTLTDDKSRHCAVYLMRNKSEVFSKFAHFVNMAENKTDSRIKVLRSDNGGEYKSAKFVRFCADRGIIQKFTPPYTPKLNGVAERMNRTLVECARCMFEHASLAKEYWGEAVMTAAFLRNGLNSCSHVAQDSLRGMDEENADTRKCQGVWVPCICARSQGKAFEAGSASYSVSFSRVFRT